MQAPTLAPALHRSATMAKKRPKHKSKSGGVLVVVRRKEAAPGVFRGGLSLTVLPPKKQNPAAQMRGACIHRVGGPDRSASITPARRASVRKLHEATLWADGVHCAEHRKDWKVLAQAGAV